jgi:hypothetical protein
MKRVYGLKRHGMWLRRLPFAEEAKATLNELFTSDASEAWSSWELDKARDKQNLILRSKGYATQVVSFSHQ